MFTTRGHLSGPSVPPTLNNVATFLIMSPLFYFAEQYDKEGVKMVINPYRKKILMSQHRHNHPSDSEEDGYSTAEDEGRPIIMQPKRKKRRTDGGDGGPTPTSTATATPQPGPSGVQPSVTPGHVQVHEKTLTALLKSTHRVDELAERVQQESGVKVPRQPEDPMHPIIKPGQKVGLTTHFYHRGPLNWS